MNHYFIVTYPCTYFFCRLRWQSWIRKNLLCWISSQLQSLTYRMLRYVCTCICMCSTPVWRSYTVYMIFYHCTDPATSPRVYPLLAYSREGQVGGGKDCFGREGDFVWFQDTWTAGMCIHICLYMMNQYFMGTYFSAVQADRARSVNGGESCFAGSAEGGKSCFVWQVLNFRITTTGCEGMYANILCSIQYEGIV